MGLRRLRSLNLSLISLFGRRLVVQRRNPVIGLVEVVFIVAIVPTFVDRSPVPVRVPVPLVASFPLILRLSSVYVLRFLNMPSFIVPIMVLVRLPVSKILSQSFLDLLGELVFSLPFASCCKWTFIPGNRVSVLKVVAAPWFVGATRSNDTVGVVLAMLIVSIIRFLSEIGVVIDSCI